MIHFFSYGDDNYKLSKKRIEAEAHNMGFDSVKVYGPQDLTDDFINKTSPFISHIRGNGYWLWKSFFLKKTFDSINEGDFCIYADAGCHINKNGKKRLSEYLKMITDHESGFLSFQMDGLLERMYTNEKVFEFFEISDGDSLRDTSQLVGGILIMKKCSNTSKIVDEYYRLACDHPYLFSDLYNDYKRTPEFRDHRHDQSILGILRKKYGCLIIPDETYSLNWQELIHVPILATRIRM